MDWSAQKRLLDYPHRILARGLSPFYRHYPYTGNLLFPRGDARGAISVADRFFYNRIPKVANSTILTTLAHLSADKNSKPITGDPKQYFARPADIPGKVASEIAQNYFKFVFVRNPYTRTLSAYLDKIVKTKGNNEAWQRWGTPNKAAEVPTFVEFCRFVRGRGRYEDAHWAPQIDCILLPLDAFDKIGKFEKLDTDLPFIIEKIFPDQHAAIRTAGPPATKAGSKLANYYDAECIEIVKEVYRDDFALFEYSTDFGDASA